MAVYLDSKQNTYYTTFKYKDFSGTSRCTTKRGFKTKEEALNYQVTFKERFNGKDDLNSSFSDLVDIYLCYSKSHCSIRQLGLKTSIFKNVIVPYFKDYKVKDIDNFTILTWHKEIIKLNLSNNTINGYHNQLSAFFNFFIKFYNLKENPARNVGHPLKTINSEMSFWTYEEFRMFISVIDDKLDRLIYETLYYTGIRLGELLALKVEDINFKDNNLHIYKSMSYYKGKSFISNTKSDKCIRYVTCPTYLMNRFKEYLESNTVGEYLFPVSRDYIRKQMDMYSDLSNVKHIRVHDLRHSHISLLIHLGCSVVDIANRVGHESIRITLRYGHMFEGTQDLIARDLNEVYQ